MRLTTYIRIYVACALGSDAMFNLLALVFLAAKPLFCHFFGLA